MRAEEAIEWQQKETVFIKNNKLSQEKKNKVGKTDKRPSY